MGKQFSDIQGQYLSDIQEFLKNYVDSLYTAPYETLWDIFYYHLGLDDPVEKQGKRIRPILVLISAAGAGIPVNRAMPVAAAIELVHNFSLIHDDIEDNGTFRRGKQSVWKKWGLAQGLNAGDAMFNAAFMVLEKLDRNFSSETKHEVYELLFHTCHKLTKGQYLDMYFEEITTVSIDTYLEMIAGKTAALMACSVEMGAVLAGLDQYQRSLYHSFGNKLGMSFQIYDDWLGIWGDAHQTGKSTISDLTERKRSYPILLGLQTSKVFREGFLNHRIDPDLARDLAQELRNAGVEEEVKAFSSKWTNEALTMLEKMTCEEEQKKYLSAIANKLLIRSR
jgi:geranylgeranyl diphosphate synthase, type I